MRRKLAALIILAALPWGCSRVLDFFGKPEVRTVGVKVVGLSTEGVALALDLGVYNPYFVPLKSPRVSYSIEVRGREVLASEQPTGVDLPARGTGMLAVPVFLSYRTVWQTYHELKDAQEVAYRLRARVMLSAFGRRVVVPVSYCGKVPVFHVPKVVGLRLRVADASLAGARVIVEAELLNRNAFPLDVSGLGYALHLGDAEVAGLRASTPAEIPPGRRGKLTLVANVRTSKVVARLLAGRGFGKARLRLLGRLKTPYGLIRLKD